MKYLNKIITVDKYLQLYPTFHNKKVVFTNGCFDILHYGHVEYLNKAKNLGDILLVGLNSDASVKRLKGNSRPINPEYARAAVLAALQCVDFVISFSEDTPLQLIEKINPNCLVKGGDYSVENVVGADFVLNNGGNVELIDFVDGFSTTHILNQL